MKRIIVALAMVAASVFVASPALAEGAATDTTTSQAPVDQAAVEQAPVEQAAPEQAPVEQAAPEQAPVEQAPVEQAAPEQAAPEQAPAEQAAPEQAPVEQAAAGGGTSKPKVAIVKKVKADEQPVVTSKKVFVCKYVGKPGEDEVLQTGGNPISVSINSIAPKFTGNPLVLIGREFADAQGFSRVIAVDIGQDEPSPEDCGTFVNPNNVEAERPRATDPTCNADGALVLPSTLNITYRSVPSGTGPGTYTVTATADDGFTLVGQSEFSITVMPKLTGVACDSPILPSATPDVVTSQNCDGGDVPQTTTVEGVTYEFTKGDGVSGPWEITATAEDDFNLIGQTVFTGDAGNPDNCGKVNPVSDDTVAPDAGVVPNAGVLPDTGGSPLGLLAISGLLIVGGATLIGRRRTI